MKNLLRICVLLPFLLAFQCGEEEPCFGKYTTIEIPSLITIENFEQNYNVNDTLWISSTLNQFQTLNNETIDLDTFDDEIGFGFQFYRSSVFNPEIFLCVSDETTNFQNGNLIDYYGCNQVTYEKNGTEYKSKFGIKLVESGNYRLEFYNISSFKESGYDCNERVLQIKTSISNTNSNSFNFTVN